MLDELETDSLIVATNGETFRVSKALAEAFRPGDLVVPSRQQGLLHLSNTERQIVDLAVSQCVTAFTSMHQVTDDQVTDFFNAFQDALRDDKVWGSIQTINEHDVAIAKERGRSTTRLQISDSMRTNMIDGLREWAESDPSRNSIVETIDHDQFQIQLQTAALGVVGFVFEGRPNVLADACGVLRGGNTAIFRIGSDALATARAIMDLALRPALIQAGLPVEAITLVDSPAHAAGWALFLDPRLALAVARGSGDSVELLGSLARSVGTPVSLHGTGGAWMIVGDTAIPELFKHCAVRSLDRKVCNTLNTCCIVASRAEEFVPVLLNGLNEAAAKLGQQYRVHVAEGSQAFIPTEAFTRKVTVNRADGQQGEFQASILPLADIGREWEWEYSPEITLVVVKNVNEAIQLFNAYSPRLVASLISNDENEHQHFYETVDAPFIGDGHTRWVDGQWALNKPELGLSNWANGRLFGRHAILTGDSVYTVRVRYVEANDRRSSR
ncbi:MAG: aldehyde dehydrogenase family protein [Pseudomonadales bacterium]